MDPRPIQDLLVELGLKPPVCRSVLLVDDEFEVLAVLEALLDEDWDVKTAQSGTEALEVLRSDTEIQLVITDQRMPGMTGVDLLQAVSSSHPDLYRMVLTAYSDVEPIVGAINQGKVDQFILKPWDPESLRRLVAEGLQVCERRAAMRMLVGHLSTRHQDQSATLDDLKLTQGASSAREWLSVADWMGITVATEVEHLLMGSASALDTLPASSPAKSILHRARALGDDLKRIAETQSNGVDAHVSPRKLISDAVRLLMGDDPEQLNPIHVDIDPQIETIQVDVAPMRQALLCLLRNAAEASPAGEPIQVSVRRPTEALVTLEVADKGAGMSAQTMLEASSPFFSEFDPPSSGLGLSLSRLVSELHGGKLAFLDNEPKGLIAQIWIRDGGS